MIIEGLFAIALRMVEGIAIALLPAAPYCYDGANEIQCPEAADFTALTGLLHTLDVGLPISSAIAPSIAMYFGVLAIAALWAVVRGVARWLPSWITGGG